MFLLENIVVAAKTFSCFHTKEPRIVCCIEKIRRKSTYSFETPKFTQPLPVSFCITETQSYKLDPHKAVKDAGAMAHYTLLGNTRTPGEGSLTSDLLTLST